ncbi:MAG TPA: asparaginase [Salinivirgaceae bacterium]|nr:asparaginase [Salinivirgaceae bacterium]
MKPNILLIYTGGTIGMVTNPATGALKPFNFTQIMNEVPELNRLGVNLEIITFDPVIDSSDMNPEIWCRLANLIAENYEKYDGFVILHGTDTMSYTASALSFMLQNLSKPVILTGSQLPIGLIRTDGKENLITAIEIASARDEKGAVVPEVAIYFETKLYRGNRTTKHNAEHFNAFSSDNYPVLAHAGIHIHYFRENILYEKPGKFQVNTKMDNNVMILKIFPGIKPEIIRQTTQIPELRGIVLETFGSGNAPTTPEFISAIKELCKRNVIVLNVSQCRAGSVNMKSYETGIALLEAGVVSGHDITTEAAITKLMFLLGNYNDIDEIKFQIKKSISGEINPIE